MRFFRDFSAAALVAASLSFGPAFAETVKDAAGRDISVPADASRIYAAGPPADVLLYVLKPQAMLGWVRAVPDSGKQYLVAETRDLPGLGRLTGKGDTLNLEGLLAAKAQMVLDYGNINATYIDLAKRVEEQTGLPYLLLDGAFAKTPETLRTLGAALDVPERGETLAAEAEAILKDTDALVAGIPEDKRPKVYLARGPEGLESAAKGSIHSEIIERAGGINVAEGDSKGPITVSPEQLQKWAPEVIITVDADFAKKAAEMPELKGIPAIENHKIYLAPQVPFGFIDAPPSVNRLLGLRWLTAKLHPELAEAGLKDDVRDFYQLFYQSELSEDQLKDLLGE
ncbi:ABC transporter substrate-binding protein [Paracoccus aminophilus]|uniref:Iron complex transport system, substrate-binding protein n=1 Tax=Paracoccus aminophilus JCM 7686 TaxID=1367847 RepID=S5XSL3_PARAH|nr:ABC transporter substrate-binding protein [Paracoccus aminophilus]AGT08102.1 iron complex transport system, substrate-binding protein [Paracoccus aminophilus JCM 7686]